MRNANACRAKDPRTCYYHGAIIEMEEAMARITSAGTKATPSDWDGYFNARKKVEGAEEELKKRQWMEEANEIVPPSREQAPRKGNHSNSYRKSGGNGKPYQKGTGSYPNNVRRTPQPKSNPVVDAPVSYNNNVFPTQVIIRDSTGTPHTYTRHDKTSQLPKGLMIAADRELNLEERQQLVNYMKYQHTISTRNGKELKTISEEDIAFDHSSRSVYVKTQFENSEQVKGFHTALGSMIANGTTPRKDNTQKYEAFSDPQASFALYYSN